MNIFTCTQSHGLTLFWDIVTFLSSQKSGISDILIILFAKLES